MVEHDQLMNNVVAKFANESDMGRGHDLAALFVDDFELIVHDVVEFQQIFADIEVARLDVLLGFSSAVLIHGCAIFSPSRSPSLERIPSMRSEPKMRIKSSSRDR